MASELCYPGEAPSAVEIVVTQNEDGVPSFGEGFGADAVGSAADIRSEALRKANTRQARLEHRGWLEGVE